MRLLNVGQAAAYLGVSAASLRSWSNQGLVPVYRTPGGQRRLLHLRPRRVHALDARARHRRPVRRRGARLAQRHARSPEQEGRHPRAGRAGRGGRRRGVAQRRLELGPAAAGHPAGHLGGRRPDGGKHPDQPDVDLVELPDDRHRDRVPGRDPRGPDRRRHDRSWVAAVPLRADHPADQPGHLRLVSAALRDRLPRLPPGVRDRPHGRPLLPARVRPLRGRPGDRLHPDRRLLQLRGGHPALRQGAPRARPPASLRAGLRPAGRRGRLPLRPVRPSHRGACSRSS